MVAYPLAPYILLFSADVAEFALFCCAGFSWGRTIDFGLTRVVSMSFCATSTSYRDSASSPVLIASGHHSFSVFGWCETIWRVDSHLLEADKLIAFFAFIGLITPLFRQTELDVKIRWFSIWGRAKTTVAEMTGFPNVGLAPRPWSRKGKKAL